MQTFSRRFVFIIIMISAFPGCKDNDPTPTRTFRMGFQNSAPRFDDFDLILQTLKMWVDPGDIADAAMITTEVPWTELLAGQTAVDYVVNNYKGLVDYYRQHDLKLWVYVDPANGLNRTSDAQALVTAGKSIANEDMQAIYRRFVIVMDSVLKPDHLGLALETNLIRVASPSTLYMGIRKAATDVAGELKLRNSKAILSISVQADLVWGGPSQSMGYTSIADDLEHFPFVQEMGISSYPYFEYSDPKDIPHDYYSAIALEAKMPVFVSEGGWSSQTVTGPDNIQIAGSATNQADYILKQAHMLNEAKAIAMFSLTFTDIDPAAIPPGVEPTIQYFTSLGVVDKDLQPKPALEKWKEIFAWSLSE